MGWLLFFQQAASLAPKFIGPAFDSEWKTYAAKLAQTKDTTILPVYFDGRNSVIYQMARRLSVTLGYSLMFREICKQMNGCVDVTLRNPIHTTELDSFVNRKRNHQFSTSTHLWGRQVRRADPLKAASIACR